MKARGLFLIAWFLALIALAGLLASVVLAMLSQAGWDRRYLELLSGAIVGCAAPVLGLVILRQQPRNRIGWLWLVYSLAVAFFSLSYALKYHANSSPPGGYPPGLFAMLLFSETSYIVRFICLMLLMLWFPDGQTPSHRWRFIHWWTAVAFILLTVELFAERVPWSDVEGYVGGGALVQNPIGFLPDRLSWPMLSLYAPIGFLSILAMSALAVSSIIIRYRSAGHVVRAQIRWFVMGSVLYAAVFFISIFFMAYLGDLPGVLGNLAIIGFYLAIGIAITRYRLYDIDVIIRKTLVYGVLTAALALVFFGGVALLQQILGGLTGTENSPIAIVVSTLAIAALVNPLRRRVQDFIDRRFYRRKYNAEQALARFAVVARDETDIEQLSTELVAVVQETMQPESVSLWLKSQRRKK